MRLLSIDFDYFVDTDDVTRYLKFPDGNDNLPQEVNDFIWDNCIRCCPEISDIGLIKDYDYMCEFLKNHKILSSEKVIVTDSHREIEKFFGNPDEHLNLVHIDFHHDMFVTGGNKLDCGNWLRFLMDFKPDLLDAYFKDLECDYEYFTAPYEKREYIKNSKYHKGEKFEFAYAITTHISQGSQFNNGIYFEEYLNRDINNKLNYTIIFF